MGRSSSGEVDVASKANAKKMLFQEITELAKHKEETEEDSISGNNNGTQLQEGKKEQSTITLSMKYPNGSFRSLVVNDTYRRLVRSVSYNDEQRIANAIVDLAELRPALALAFCEVMRKEVTAYTKSETVSKLHKKQNPGRSPISCSVAFMQDCK